eukprot:TRINITY_DN6380_c0_g3_i1.p1 TRINITY_DN6380_c0_g3~~TRINITY_DN6380_c0_g3_i1.p1  ORF type:complete len:260 (+),score=81.35 TRINITY_DN6380_c0_g3_i1:70-849(+)
MSPKNTMEVKQYGAEVDAFVAAVRDNVKLSDFLASAGENCVCLERFVNKETVYFTGDIHPDTMEALKIRRRKGFRIEIRNSNVLLLSVKGKPHLSLDEALEIVNESALKNYMHSIEVVAVVPKGHSRARATMKQSAHAYIKFSDHMVAKQCVNAVDAFEYKGFFVHSPQLDAHEFMMNESEYAERRSFVWVNEDVLRKRSHTASPAASVSSSTYIDSPVSVAGEVPLFSEWQSDAEWNAEWTNCEQFFEYSPEMIQAFY